MPGAIMQFKVWLLGLSPMVWRRMHVPATSTLRQLHGVIQVAMGWEGIHLFQFHLRAIRYGSWEAAARSPDVTLESLCLRKGARFAYEYDLNIPWRREVRLEERLELTPKRAYPFCADGSGACPPEDCGGPAGYLTQREARCSIDALNDLGVLAEIIEKAALEERRDDLDANIQSLFEEVVERTEERERWTGRPFSRRTVNSDLRQGRHLILMHQQH